MEKTRSTIYVDPTLWRKFRELCVREGESCSEKIEEWIREYVRQHEPGNPQMLITKFTTGSEPTPQTCFLCGKRQASWIGFLKPLGEPTKRHPLCDECKRNATMMPAWRQFEEIR